jgi:hypothetical protein
VLIGTWRTTRENSATTRVEWDTLGQVIRKTRERLPYLKGISGGASLQSIGRFSVGLPGFSDGTFLCFLLPESVAGFLELLELWKGLVVLLCLVSSVEMNGKSRSLGK